MSADVLLYTFEDVTVMAQVARNHTTHEDKRVVGAVTRAFIRTLSAYLEGLITALKAACLTFGKADGTWIFTEDELAVLREDGSRPVRLNDRGQVQPGERVTGFRFRDNLKFSVRMFARLTDFTPDFGGEAWKAIDRLIETRDNLTHPRCASDMARGTFDEGDPKKIIDWAMRIVQQRGKHAFDMPWRGNEGPPIV